MGTNLTPVEILTDCYKHQHRLYGAAVIKDENDKEHQVSFDFNREDSTSRPRVIFADGRKVVVSDHFVTKMYSLMTLDVLDPKEKEEVCKQFPKEKKNWKDKSIYVATGLQGGVAWVDRKGKSFVDPMTRNGVFAVAPYFEIGQQILHRGSKGWGRSQYKHFVRAGLDYADSSQTALRKSLLVGSKISLKFPEGKRPVEVYWHLSMFAGFGATAFINSLLTGDGSGSLAGRLAIIGVGIAGTFVGDTIFKKHLGQELTIGAVHQAEKGLLGFFEMSQFTIGLAFLDNARIELQASVRAIFGERRFIDPMTGELKTTHTGALEFPLRAVAQWTF